MVKDVARAEQTTPIVQLGAESQLYEDLFPNGVEDYRKICEALIPGIRQKLPNAVISGDGSNGRNPDWDDAVASIPGVDALRLYLQIRGEPYADYPGMRRRVNVDLPHIVDDFMENYPAKRIVFLQMALKNRHPYHHRVAHGLYLAELYVRLAKMNLGKDDVIVVASQMNLKHIFSRDLLPMPPYFGMLAVKDIWGGVAQNSGVGGTELVTFAVEKQDGHHVVVINPTEKPVTIDRVVIDGEARDDYEVRGYYGTLSSTTVSEFDSLAMPAYSWASAFVPSE